MNSHPNIIFIMATKMEADPFISGLDLKPMAAYPVQVFKNQDRVLIISGIGKTNASIAATYGCLTFTPKLLCNLGAAGAVNSNLSLGDMFQISNILEYDRPNLRSDGIYSYQPEILKRINTANLATQDKPILDVVEREELSHHVQLVDMEAAAIAHVCKKFAVPCHVLKFVSDTPEHTKGKDIVANIKFYREKFYSWVLKNILPKL